MKLAGVGCCAAATVSECQSPGLQCCGPSKRIPSDHPPPGGGANSLHLRPPGLDELYVGVGESWVLRSSSAHTQRGKGLGSGHADKHLEDVSVKTKMCGGGVGWASWEPMFWSWELVLSKVTKI